MSEPEYYEPGALNDFGGGNVEWWFDYIRYLLESAHTHYCELAQQVESEPAMTIEMIRAGMAKVVGSKMNYSAKRIMVVEIYRAMHRAALESNQQ